MKGLRFLGNSKLELTDLPDPVVGEGDVLCRVKTSAICGSEMETFPGDAPLEGNPGHEVMGIVEDPNGSKRFHKGDRVGISTIQGCGSCFWCRQGKQIFCKEAGVVKNAHSEYVVSKDVWLHPLDDDIDNATAVLISGDGLGVPYGSTVRSGVQAGDITCVFGTGPVGMGMTLLQTYLGARVIAVDINPHALEHAKNCGAWKTINPRETDDIEAALLDLTGGLGPNKSFDACGNQEMFNVAMETTIPGGTIVTVAHGEHGIDNVRQRLSFRVKNGKVDGRNLTIIGNWLCYFSDFEHMRTLVRNGLQVDLMVTNQFPIDQAPEAYRRVAEGLEGKVMLTQ